jgi:Putative MetA-pathway of phenol degradation
MSGEQITMMRRGSRGWTALALSVVLGLGGRAAGDPDIPTATASPPVTNTASEKVVPAVAPATGPVVPAITPSTEAAGGGGGVVQAGCASCGGGGLLSGPVGPAGGCVGCGVNCYPGREGCDCCANPKGPLCGLLYGIYECICCPDPCYQPRWDILANSAFFTNGVQPITQMRLRTDFVWDQPFPDKGEYFWARADGMGKMQRLPRNGMGQILQRGETSVDHSDLRLYMEGAVERFSLFLEMDYRRVDPANYPGASGFGDLTIGTKSLLLDCELLKVTFQFQTFVPTGNFTQGIGTGHTSLEPSLLYALKVTPTTALQGQFAYLFPIGGDQKYQGSVFHYHLALNQILWSCGKDVQLVGVLEGNGYHFANGLYTIPTVGINPPSLQGRARDVGQIFSMGPGVRLNICNKIDFGIGSAFAITNDSIGDQWIRADFRWRF